MAIIDDTYFFGDINLAQLGQPAVKENLDLFIAKYEPIILEHLLGYRLYTDFVAGLGTDPIAEKWLDLRDGAEYTGRHGKTKWIGLTNKKRSLIANYVYVEYMRDEYQLVVGSGVITPEVENATRIGPRFLQVRAWNEMVDLNYQLLNFLLAKQDVYGQPAVDIRYHRNCRHELLEKINTFNL